MSKRHCTITFLKWQKVTASDTSFHMWIKLFPLPKFQMGLNTWYQTGKAGKLLLNPPSSSKKVLGLQFYIIQGESSSWWALLQTECRVQDTKLETIPSILHPISLFLLNSFSKTDVRGKQGGERRQLKQTEQNAFHTYLMCSLTKLLVSIRVITISLFPKENHSIQFCNLHFAISAVIIDRAVLLAVYKPSAGSSPAAASHQWRCKCVKNRWGWYPKTQAKLETQNSYL